MCNLAGSYFLRIKSENQGKLQHHTSPQHRKYTLMLGGNPINDLTKPHHAQIKTHVGKQQQTAA